MELSILTHSFIVQLGPASKYGALSTVRKAERAETRGSRHFADEGRSTHFTGSSIKEPCPNIAPLYCWLL